MFQRVCLAGSIPRQCPYYDCNRPPWRIWPDEEKRWLRDLAARTGVLVERLHSWAFAILPFA